MRAQGKASTALRAACLLLLVSAMLGGVPVRAEAGSADFCDDASYDNDVPQTTGLFTDLRRGSQISGDYARCQLKLTGSVGSASDMWITLLQPPGQPVPKFNCVNVDADVVIHRFDNRKGIGFVANYDAATGRGLFFAIYNNGSNDAMTLSTFDGTTGKLTGTVANVPLGSKIQENVTYGLEVRVCATGGTLKVEGTVSGGFGDSTLSFDGPVPAGISNSGQIGIGGWAKSAFVDSTVLNFEWSAAVPSECAPPAPVVAAIPTSVPGGGPFSPGTNVHVHIPGIDAAHQVRNLWFDPSGTLIPQGTSVIPGPEAPFDIGLTPGQFSANPSGTWNVYSCYETGGLTDGLGHVTFVVF